MLRILTKLPVLLFGLIAPAFAAEQFYEFKHQGPDPDHLLVVTGYHIEKLKQMGEDLNFPYASLATMITAEPFGGFSGVCLAGLLPMFVDGDSPGKMETQQYRLIFSNRPTMVERQAGGALNTESMEVPLDFAIAMQRLWVQFTLGAGHRPCAEWIMDGDTQYFVARPGEDFISGYLRMPPEGGLCDKMLKLATSLEELKNLEGDLKKQKLEALLNEMKLLSKQFPTLPDRER
jgi:hypothetical protein